MELQVEVGGRQGCVVALRLGADAADDLFQERKVIGSGSPDSIFDGEQFEGEAQRVDLLGIPASQARDERAPVWMSDDEPFVLQQLEAITHWSPTRLHRLGKFSLDEALPWLEFIGKDGLAKLVGHPLAQRAHCRR